MSNNWQICAEARERLLVRCEAERDALKSELAGVREELKSLQIERLNQDAWWVKEIARETSVWKAKCEKLAKLVMDKVAFRFTDPQGNFTELITMAQSIALDEEGQ